MVHVAYAQLHALRTEFRTLDLYSADGHHALAASFAAPNLIVSFGTKKKKLEKLKERFVRRGGVASSLATILSDPLDGTFHEFKGANLALVNPPANGTTIDMLFFSIAKAATMIQEKGYIQAIVPIRTAQRSAFVSLMRDIGLKLIARSEVLWRPNNIGVAIILLQKTQPITFGHMMFTLADLLDMVTAGKADSHMQFSGCLCPHTNEISAENRRKGIWYRICVLQEVALMREEGRNEYQDPNLCQEPTSDWEDVSDEDDWISESEDPEPQNEHATEVE